LGTKSTNIRHVFAVVIWAEKTLANWTQDQWNMDR